MVERSYGGRIIHALRWVGRHELGALVALLLVVGSVWAFVELADAVVEGATRRFDEAVLRAMRTPGDPADPIGPTWVEVLARDVTALGGTGWLAFLTMVVAGFLMLAGKGRAAVFVLAAVAGGLVLSGLLKVGFDRPRPALVPHATYVATPSFPSGHAMGSAVVYLTLGALLARVQARLRLKAYLLLLAVLLTFAVGVTRIYLGVHWPTDVVAGWAAGTAWALTCWLVARWLQRRGAVERDTPGESERPPPPSER